MVRAERANPAPPYGQHDRKAFVFYAFPNECTKLLLNDDDHGDFGVDNSCPVDVNVDESSPQ